jgi:hypothetical protein
MSELDLFGGEGRGQHRRPGPARRTTPDPMRRWPPGCGPGPWTSSWGRRSVLGEGRALRGLIEKDEVGSLILWGPPGTGKTTIARVIAASGPTRPSSRSAPSRRACPGSVRS